MRRVLVVLVLATACGGVQVPTHNGYKSDKVKPWKKAKTLKFDDKSEAKVEGDLSYPAMKRAAWFGVNVDSPSQLDLRLEITPPGDAVNDDFDLALEVLDPGNKVIAKSDLEDEDAHEPTKTKSLKDLPPGRYLVHLYLQSRLDTADYVLRATLKPTNADVGKSDFPAQVAFPTPLPLVPLQDDTPAGYKVATKTPPPHRPPHGGHTPPDGGEKKPPDPPPGKTISSEIIGVQVSGANTTITLSGGTTAGAAPGMKVKISGISEAITLGDCKPRSCSASVHATPDQLKGAGGVTITP
jgi:hypothetical protein